MEDGSVQRGFRRGGSVAAAVPSAVLRRSVIRRGKPAYASSHSRRERLTSPERALCGLRIRLQKGNSSIGREDGTNLNRVFLGS